MGMVVCFVKIHIRPYMDDIFTLIRVSNCVNNPPPLYFPVSQANSCKLLIALSCARHLLGVMYSGPLDEV